MNTSQKPSSNKIRIKTICNYDIYEHYQTSETIFQQNKD